MMKLGGAGNIADSTSPPQIDTRHRAVETTIARIGVVVTIVAVAAGVTTSAKISNVPTAGTAIVITPASTAMNSTFISPIVKRTEQQGAVRDGKHGQQHHIEYRESDDLTWGDREDGSEQDRLELL